MTAIEAIYIGGKFQPLGSVNLAENQRVRLTFEPSRAASPSEDEILRRFESANSLKEMMEIWKQLPADEGDYDMERWIQESRKLAGETTYLEGLP